MKNKECSKMHSPEVKCDHCPDLDEYIVMKTCTVCNSCLRSSCWQGEFYCEDYRTAGTKEMKISELEKLELENPSYWGKYWKPGKVDFGEMRKDVKEICKKLNREHRTLGTIPDATGEITCSACGAEWFYYVGFESTIGRCKGTLSTTKYRICKNDLVKQLGRI